MDISLNRHLGEIQLRERIYLWGMPGVGKSTVARKLATGLGWIALDLDTQIEQHAGMSIPEIFRSEGESGFRLRERRALEQTGEAHQCVVAVGGGAPCQPGAADWMRSHGLCITMVASVGFITQRLWQSKVERPLLADSKSKEELQEKLENTLGQRQVFYEKAHAAIPALNLDVEEMVRWLRSIQAQ